MADSIDDALEELAERADLFDGDTTMLVTDFGWEFLGDLHGAIYGTGWHSDSCAVCKARGDDGVDGTDK